MSSSKNMEKKNMCDSTNYSILHKTPESEKNIDWNEVHRPQKMIKIIHGDLAWLGDLVC